MLIKIIIIIVIIYITIYIYSYVKNKGLIKEKARPIGPFYHISCLKRIVHYCGFPYLHSVNTSRSTSNKNYKSVRAFIIEYDTNMKVFHKAKQSDECMTDIQVVINCRNKFKRIIGNNIYYRYF